MGASPARAGFAVLLGAAALELLPFLGPGLPLAFDGHSHLTRAWLAARAFEAGAVPSWSFVWYGGFRPLEFYGPAYYVVTGTLGAALGDVAAATKLALYAGQICSVLAVYGVLLRLGLSALPALFGALVFLYDAQRWLVLAVIGNHPSLFVYVALPILLWLPLRSGPAPRAVLRLFALRSLVLAAMALGQFTNSAYVLPALLAFEVAWALEALPRAAAGRSLLGLAGSLVALVALTAFATVPGLFELDRVSLSLDAGAVLRPTPSIGPVATALGFREASWDRIFVASSGAPWSALALAAGGLSLHRRHRRGRPWLVGLLASLASVAWLGDRAAIAPAFFVAPLGAIAFDTASRALRGRAARAAALLLVLAVPLWHRSRDLPPLGYLDPGEFALYQRLAREPGRGRSFDVTPSPLSLDGVYGPSSFSPAWTGRSVPFGGFPQAAPLATNVQLALLGPLVSGLRAPEPALSEDALDLLYLLGVEHLVERGKRPALARLAPDPKRLEPLEPGLLRLRQTSPAVFAPRIEGLARTGSGPNGPPALLDLLEERWESDPLGKEPLRSLDALARSGARSDWRLVLPWLRAVALDRSRARAEVLLVERLLSDPAPGAEGDFELLAQREAPTRVEVVVRASAPGFVRLAYAHDPALAVALDGAPVASVPDFLGGVVLALPAGTHTITLDAPRASLTLALLLPCAALAVALAALAVAGA